MYGSSIYVAWQAADNSHSIHIGYSDVISQCSTNPLSCQFQNGTTISRQSTDSAPSLGVSGDGGTIYAAWKGYGNASITIEQTNDGINWYNRTVLTDTTIDSPALTSYQGNLYVGWAGTGSTHYVYFGYYTDNNHVLYNHTSTPEYTNSGITLISANNRLQIGFDSATSLAVVTGSWAPGSSYRSSGPFPGAFSAFPPALSGGNLYFTGTDSRINEVQISQ